MRVAITILVVAVVVVVVGIVPLDDTSIVAYPEPSKLFLPIVVKGGLSVPAPTLTATPLPTATATATPVLGGGVTYADLDGNSWLLSADDTFIGRIWHNQFDANSIMNPFGDYGSQFSSNSIFNPFGIYGSPFSDKSTWNQFASNPPLIIYQGSAFAYLTENAFKTPRVDTSNLIAYLQSVQ